MSMKRFLIVSAILSLATGTALASPSGKTTVLLTWTPHASNGWSQSWDYQSGWGIGRVQGTDSGTGGTLAIRHTDELSATMQWGIGARIGRGISHVDRDVTNFVFSPSLNQYAGLPRPLSQRVTFAQVYGTIGFVPSDQLSASVSAAIGHTSLKTDASGQIPNSRSANRTVLRPRIAVTLVENWGSLRGTYAQQPWVMPATLAYNPSPATNNREYAAPRRLKLEYWTTPELWGSISITGAIYRPDTAGKMFNTGHRIALGYVAPGNTFIIEVGRVTGFRRPESGYLTPGLPAVVAAATPMAPWRAYVSGLYASIAVNLGRWKLEGLAMSEPGQAGAPHVQTTGYPKWNVNPWNTSTDLTGGTYLSLGASYTW